MDRQGFQTSDNRKCQGKILPLSKEVIDRIAAGEVVQRPASVVKELIENSLDADGTLIDIHIQKGGLQSITITDNGIGISPSSLPLACTRFATSKLSSVEDLKSIRTFGFRGEALASASMVGRVCIISRLRRDGGARILSVCDDEDLETKSSSSTSNCAFKMHYCDGQPVPNDEVSSNSNNQNVVSNTATAVSNVIQPKPSAGKEGTTIHVKDLFHNIPTRRRAMEGRRNEREEYNKILNVVQRYAVHEARRGVGFSCRSGEGDGAYGNRITTDLNTQSLASVKKLHQLRKLGCTRMILDDNLTLEEEEMMAMKDAIGHIYGTAISRELLSLRVEEGNVEAVHLEALKAIQLEETSAKATSSSSYDFEPQEHHSLETVEETAHCSKIESPHQLSKFAFAYKATGLITNAFYSAPKSSSAFLLFINDRLVESGSLRRAIESVYSGTQCKGGKPFVYLSLELPGPHVDVNVHPTKKEVALLHEDRLCDALAKAVKEVIGSASSSRTFVMAAAGSLLQPERKIEKKLEKDVPIAVGCVDKSQLSIQQDPSKSDQCIVNMNVVTNDEISRSVPPTKVAELPRNIMFCSKTDKSNAETNKKRRIIPDQYNESSLKKVHDPSRLVRTNTAAPAGALEPFLMKSVPINSRHKGNDKEIVEHTATATGHPTEDLSLIRHEEGCPLANQPSPDMTLPGAFVTAICRCQIQCADSLPPISNGILVRNIASGGNSSSNIVRPKKVIPTECDYQSIANLRTDISTRNHQGLNETIRGSIYVGAVSRSRSLIQSGIDLLMVNHFELARETFYQLALIQFGGMPTAKLGGCGVDVTSVIEYILEASERESIDSQSTLKISDTNSMLAKQITTCLAEKASMLGEYFSIKLEERATHKSDQQLNSLYLTGLPILLDGHSPQPHALPSFLMRLATEVNWIDEQSCFQGICYEIGSFYAELPVASSVSQGENPIHESPDLIVDEAKAYIKHSLFPAISFLLVPPKDFVDDGTVLKLANLTSLYKVFERC